MPTAAEALHAALERWNAGDLEGYLTLYDERIRLHGYSPQPMDKAQVRAFYQGIWEALDTPRQEFHEVLWDGDACAIRFTTSGRHVGELMGASPTGARVDVPGITILHFEGDRVVERFSQADMLGMLIQVGALPSMA